METPKAARRTGRALPPEDEGFEEDAEEGEKPTLKKSAKKKLPAEKGQAPSLKQRAAGKVVEKPEVVDEEEETEEDAEEEKEDESKVEDLGELSELLEKEIEFEAKRQKKDVRKVLIGMASARGLTVLKKHPNEQIIGVLVDDGWRPVDWREQLDRDVPEPSAAKKRSDHKGRLKDWGGDTV